LNIPARRESRSPRNLSCGGNAGLLCSGHVTEIAATGQERGVRELLYKPGTFAEFSSAISKLIAEALRSGAVNSAS